MHTHRSKIGQMGLDIRTLLRRDHERLERLFDELLSAFRAGATDDTARRWREFEDALRVHFELEEEWILPAFARFDPAEADALRAEHAQIRVLLTELGVGVDLHQTRADAVSQLVDTLKQHAAREQSLLYQWAHTELPRQVKVAIGDKLRAKVRRIVVNAAARAH